jgi:putative addiction module killer protein
MNAIHETNVFAAWLEKLKDRQGKVRILARIRSAKAGNFGDCKALGDGVSEMRVHSGPGYRVYFGKKEAQVYLLILGGDKTSQERDIRRAKAMWRMIGKGEP